MKTNRLLRRIAFALRLRRHPDTIWLPSDFQVRRVFFFGMMSEFSHPTEQFCRIARERGIVYRVGKKQLVQFCDETDWAKFNDFNQALNVTFRGDGNGAWFPRWLKDNDFEIVMYSPARGYKLTRMSDVIEVQLAFTCRPDERHPRSSGEYRYYVVEEPS